MNGPAPPARPAGRVVDAALELLDRQLVDADGVAAGKVDDLELTGLEDGSLVVTAILSGPGALAPRLGGRLGAAWAAMLHHVRPEADPAPARISFGAVREMTGAQLRLGISRHHLDGNRMEQWVRTRFIARIPGAGHEPE